ncbi:MAG: hypothetical protein ACTSQ8_24495 [Candidatus Helarchaeota archaeon]
MVKRLLIYLLFTGACFAQYVNDLEKPTVATITAKDSVNLYIEALNGSSVLTPYKLPLDSLKVWLRDLIGIVDGGTANNIAGTDSLNLTVTAGPSAYVQNMLVKFEADTINTGAFYIQINSLGWKAVKKLNDQDPGNSHIEAGSSVLIMYDGTNFQMLQPAAN